MNALVPVLLLLLIAGVIGVIATASQMWAAGGSADDEVGPRQPRQRAVEAPVMVPGLFRSLIQGEAAGWKRVDQWELLTQRLDNIERELGGTPAGHAPEHYSAEWLDRRIARIENIAGPLPAQIRPRTITTPNRLPWKRT